MMQNGRIKLAIYDLDRTITRIPTWTPFLLRAAWEMAPWRLGLIPVIGLAALGRAVGLHDRDRLKTIMHRYLLGPKVDPRKLAAVVERFADRMTLKHIQPGARQSLTSDRDEGRQIVIATAAHRFYADDIARRLGVADVIATEASLDEFGMVLPNLAGENCYGRAKHRMIMRWLEQQSLSRENTHIRFYSDHISDLPTFDWADEAIVVDAGPTLRALAQQRGWRTVSWRNAGD